MAIFPRRVIQSLLDKSHAFLSEAQARKFVTDLNGDPCNAVPWEWELVLLSSLNTLGTVRYEPCLGRSTRPGVLFSLTPPLKGGFVGEITTVSDRSAHERNPAEQLSLDLVRLIRKKGLIPNRFSLHIGSDRIARPQGEKVFLKIPKKTDFRSTIFTSAFGSFLRKVKASPEEKRDFQVATSSVTAKINYAPTQEFFSRAHANYALSSSPVANVVSHALKEKARQLGKCSHCGPFGIFLCDGDCEILRTSLNPRDKRGAEVIEQFLRKHRRISFVQVLGISMDSSAGLGARGLAVCARLFKGACFDALPGDVRNALAKLETYVPRPETYPLSARLTPIAWPTRTGYSFAGGCAIMENRVKFSARVLLDYLAGRIEHQEFLVQAGLYQKGQPQQSRNLFERWLKAGNLISSVALDRRSDKDDDWLTVACSGPDPAISNFSVRFREDND